jgi:hypothetical protein
MPGPLKVDIIGIANADFNTLNTCHVSSRTKKFDT